MNNNCERQRYDTAAKQKTELNRRRKRTKYKPELTLALALALAQTEALTHGVMDRAYCRLRRR